MNVGDVYNGNLLVLSFDGCLNVLVRFIDTGFETRSSAQHVRSGRIKDKLKPSVYGAGFIGDGTYKAKVNNKTTAAYIAWKGMLQRCYDEKWRKANPYYCGVTVSSDWLNFQLFAEWFYKSLPSDGGKYQLDKDSMVSGNKVYSAETCCLLTQADNVREAASRADHSKRKVTAKRYMVVSPGGVEIEVVNLAKFCRENGLLDSHMSSVASGRRSHHRGWTAELLRNV